MIAPAPRRPTSSSTPTFDAHGYRFRVESPDDQLVATLADLLADLLVDLRCADSAPADDPEQIDPEQIDPEQIDPEQIEVVELDTDGEGRRWYRMVGSHGVRHDRLWEGALVSHLLVHVNRRASSSRAGRNEVPIHGGAAADGRGVVLLPGRSESGKTTLATALAVHGWTLVADEVCRVDPDTLTVARYGKPVALRSRSVELLADRIPRLGRPPSRFERDERFVPPSELSPAPSPVGDAPGQRRQPGRAVVALVFPSVDVTAPTTIEPLSPGRALERLVEHTLAGPGAGASPSAATVAARRRRAGFAALDRLVRDAPAWELTMSDLDEACRLVDAAIGPSGTGAPC